MDELKHGDQVYVRDDHPEYGYIGQARFVKHIKSTDVGSKWDGWIHLLDIEPHCAVHIKGDKYPAVFPTRCVKKGWSK